MLLLRDWKSETALSRSYMVLNSLDSLPVKPLLHLWSSDDDEPRAHGSQSCEPVELTARYEEPTLSHLIVFRTCYLSELAAVATILVQ